MRDYQIARSTFSAPATGRTDPIPLPSKMDGLGLGKASIETRMLSEAIAHRPRVLDSMRIANETEEERLAREVGPLVLCPCSRLISLPYQAAVASKAEIKAGVQDTLAKFYCDICSKGYANVKQWEEHIQSYGHNHAKRKHELAMQSRSNKNKIDEVNKRREKEKRREQQELERMVKAAGGVMPVHPAPPVVAVANASAPKGESGSPVAEPAVPKKTGFFKVAGATTIPPASSIPQFKYQPQPPQPSTDAPRLPSAPSQTITASPPRFTSSSASSLASTFASSTRSPTLTRPEISASAHAWKPLNAPELHPLLAGNVSTPSTFAKPKDIRSQRNDLFKRGGGPADTRPYEIPTAASSQGVSKAPKGMSFVPSAGSMRPGATQAASPAMSLNKVVPKKKALDMGEDEENEGEADLLPTGRPKAQKGRIGFS